MINNRNSPLSLRSSLVSCGRNTWKIGRGYATAHRMDWTSARGCSRDWCKSN